MELDDKHLIYSLSSIKDNDLTVNICEWDDQIQIHIIKPETASVTLTIYEPDFKTGFITSLYVHPEVRGLKIGTILITACLDIANVIKCKILALNVKPNTFVYNWYNRLGFIDYRTDDGLITLIKVL